MAKIRYITEKELLELNDRASLTGMKQGYLSKLLSCSETYFSLMLSGKKKINRNKLPLINNILDRYIQLYNDLNTDNKEKDDRINEKYSSTLKRLDNLEDYNQLGSLFEDVEDDYLLEKLDNALSFALDNNTSISTMGASFKSLIQCYG